MMPFRFRQYAHRSAKNVLNPLTTQILQSTYHHHHHFSSSSSSSATIITFNTKSAGGQQRVANLPTFPFKQPSLATHGGYINGKWVGAKNGKTIAVTNPADGSVIAHVPNMTAPDTLAAIDAASSAFPSWSARTAFDRAAIVRRLYTLLHAHVDSIAALLTAETGKPLGEAQGEVKYAADFFEWYAEEGKRAYGEILPPMRGDRRMLVIQQPVGPTALLTPWNFPAAMPARKIAPALASGCTIVLRPSINTPLTAIAMTQLAEEAGVPPGVLNLVLGEDHAETAGVLCASPAIRKLSFTGSTPVGKQLVTQCAPTLKRVSMELGGRAPFIVFDDADVDVAIEGALASKFRNAGQTCVCANTFFVQAGIHDVFVAKLAEKVRAMKVGDGLVPGISIGPVIHERALKATEAFVQDAVAKGAKIVVGGKRAAGGSVGNSGNTGSANGGKGWFFEPTIMTDVNKSSNCVNQEIFGPLAPIVRFSTEAEVIAAANSSSVGLAAYFFTKDSSRVWRVAEALQVGMVGHNTGLISTANAPFGGVKESGYGREGARHGLAEYMQYKYIMTGV